MKKATKKGPELLAIWRQMMEKLLSKFDFSEEEIKDILDKVIAADAELAKYVLSNEERSEYNKLYHPYEWVRFQDLGSRIATRDLLYRSNWTNTR